MATKVKAYDLGKYQRRIDLLNEEENEEYAKQIADALKWMTIKTPKHTKSEGAVSGAMRELINMGLALDQVGQINHLKVLKGASQQGTIIDKGISVFKDLSFAIKDVFSGLKIKTSLTTVGLIAVGAGIGFVVGTFLLPVIGSAIGGAAGAAIATGLAAIGGVIGTTILGAWGGSWLGKKISNKFFKHEKRYEVSKRITRKIQKQMGIESATVQKMNGYLFNRSKAVQSPSLKKAYKDLRRAAINDVEPEAMEKMAFFFCQELAILKNEMKGGSVPKELQTDIDAVVEILEALNTASGIDKKTKAKITKDINDFNKAVKKKDDVLPGIDLEQSKEISHKEMQEMKESFVKELKGPAFKEKIKKVEAKETKTLNETCYHYKIQGKNGHTLPEVQFRERKEQDHYVADVVVDSKPLEKDRKLIAKVMATQAKIACQKMNKDHVGIKRHGDNELGKQLLAQTKQIGLKADLIEEEPSSVGVKGKIKQLEKKRLTPKQTK